MNHVVRIALLTVLWVFLWGDLSVANVASGVAVAGLLLWLTPDTRRASGGRAVIRPLGLARLATHVVGQLVVSNASVLREIGRPGAESRAAVVACRLTVPSDRIMTLLANVMSLSPDTIPLELSTDPPRILLHVLDVRDPEAVRRSVTTLERLVVDAVGTADERALLHDTADHPEVAS